MFVFKSETINRIRHNGFGCGVSFCRFRHDSTMLSLGMPFMDLVVFHVFLIFLIEKPPTSDLWSLSRRDTPKQNAAFEILWCPRSPETRLGSRFPRKTEPCFFKARRWAWLSRLAEPIPNRWGWSFLAERKKRICWLAMRCCTSWEWLDLAYDILWIGHLEMLSGSHHPQSGWGVLQKRLTKSQAGRPFSRVF